MKFICEKENLMKALNIASKGVSTRTTLPILKGILIKCENNEIRLFSSDLDISIETVVSALVEERGEVVVSAKLFIDIVREMPQGNIVFELREGNTAFF